MENKLIENELAKAEVLIEALPYIQKFNRKIIVVKYGGSAMVDEELKRKVIQDVVLLKLVGFKPIIVHGGGKEISKWVKLSGKEFYKFLSDKLDSQKKASLLLYKYGIKGIHYFGEQDGECVVIFNPEDLHVLKKFYGGKGIEMERIGG